MGYIYFQPKNNVWNNLKFDEGQNRKDNKSEQVLLN